ncbi:hypothetical protein D3C76_1629020 [compost metagenome]
MISTMRSLKSRSSSISGYSAMNSLKAGITRAVTCGRLMRRRPRGVSFDCNSSSSTDSISVRMRRLRSRNTIPSAVRVMLRVLR